MQKFVAYDQLAHADRVIQIHGLLVGAIQAMEGAGRTVCDFTHAMPWEFTIDLARQVWDKARHVDIFVHLLAHVEDAIGVCPEHALQSPDASAQTSEACVAGGNRGLDGRTWDALVQLIELARNIGDPVMERALDVVLADEITHVHMRRTWRRELSAYAPERLRQALELQQSRDGSGVLSMRGQSYAVV